jgi:hypothetical protein
MFNFLFQNGHDICDYRELDDTSGHSLLVPVSLETLKEQGLLDVSDSRMY